MTEKRRPASRGSGSGGLVRSVLPGSLAESIGLRAGDRIVAIDGQVLRDAIDYRFYAAEDSIRLTALRDGTRLTLTVQKDPDEDLGIEFERPTFHGVRSCNNRCFFCFLKGLPKGLRRSLYVKDDDYRLSFLHGNFITMTNLTEADWRRIDEQRLSPLYVSVHATDLGLRRHLLGNPAAPDVMEQLRRLRDLGLEVHTQLVACPGVNDGQHLARTVADLASLYPAVRSIGIVPVGATKYAEERSARAGRAGDMGAYSAEDARTLVRQVGVWQRAFRRRSGVGLAYLADEYYLTAGLRIPSAARYDGYPQFENGIGMARSLIEDWRRTGRRAASRPRPRADRRRLILACGTLIAPVLQGLAPELAELGDLAIEVVTVENRFFGPRVNVSGLLVADDIIRGLRGRCQGDLVVLPRYALDYGGERFLDDGTPADVELALGRPVAFARTLSDVLNAMTMPAAEPW